MERWVRGMAKKLRRVFVTELGWNSPNITVLPVDRENMGLQIAILRQCCVKMTMNVTVAETLS